MILRVNAQAVTRLILKIRSLKGDLNVAGFTVRSSAIQIQILKNLGLEWIRS